MPARNFGRTLRLLAPALLLMVATAQPLHADTLNRSLETLNKLNQIQPLQNPGYHTGDKLLGGRILDRKNKVVGELHDILLTPGGEVSSIAVEFDRLRLNTEVYLGYNDLQIKPVSNGYALGLDDGQIKNAYPEMLAGIESAAGNSDIFSVRKIVGADVKARDGRHLGVVDQVLFTGNGARAEALYVAMKYGTLRGEGVAIPFGSARIGYKDGRTSVLVGDDIADSMISIAQND